MKCNCSCNCDEQTITTTTTSSPLSDIFSGSYGCLQRIVDNPAVKSDFNTCHTTCNNSLESCKNVQGQTPPADFCNTLCGSTAPAKHIGSDCLSKVTSKSENRKTYNGCLAICNSARTGECKQYNIPAEYCNDACAGISSSTESKIDSTAVFNKCSADKTVGKCRSSELENCFITECKNTQPCMSDNEGWATNFCQNKGSWPGGQGEDNGGGGSNNGGGGSNNGGGGSNNGGESNNGGGSKSFIETTTGQVVIGVSAGIVLLAIIGGVYYMYSSRSKSVSNK